MFERLDRRLAPPSHESAHRMFRAAARIDALSGWWEGYRAAAPHGLSRLADDAVAAGADASARISRRGFQKLPGTVDRGESMVTAAVRSGCEAALREVVDRHAALPPCEATLLSLHAALFSASPADAPIRGRYRAAGARDGTLQRWGLEPTALRISSPTVAPGETAFLLSWTASRLSDPGGPHPLQVIAACLLEFLAIQPFSDGNGRMARLLATLLLLRSGYGFAAFSPIDAVLHPRQDEALIALRKSQATRNTPKPDITPWLFAFLDIVDGAADALKRRLLQAAPARALSGNQERALALAVRHGEVTNRRLAETLGLPRETAKQTLGRLVELGLLERLGQGRAARYRRPPA
jgi:hypothetical protein